MDPDNSSFKPSDATQYRILNSAGYHMFPEIQGILIGHHRIQEQVSRLAYALNKHFAGQRVITIPIMMGGMTFAGDLERMLMFDVIRDPMSLASYKDDQSTGQVRHIYGPGSNLQGEKVLVIEDIIDTGRSYHYVMQMLRERGAIDITFVALLSKPSRRVVAAEADFTGFIIGDHYVVGYGMDSQKRFRHLRDICVLRPTTPKKIPANGGVSQKG
jgi:hypoxanthine phosphoribosyltransferase